MPTINFLGDFKCDNVSNLHMNTLLQSAINEAEINVLNFEAPVINDKCCPIEKSGPNIHQDSAAPAWLERNGFNVISLANNHAYDYGREGLLNTLNAFSGNVTLCGGGTVDEAYKVVYREVDGIKIAILAITQHEFGVLDATSQPDDIGTAGISSPRVPLLILEAKRQADFLFVYPHAGIEQVDFPLPQLRELYRSWIDLGADAVIASHPHIIQPWETYKGKPIYYSLGNFCFSLSAPPKSSWYDSLIVTIDIREHNIQFIPRHIRYKQAENILMLSENMPLEVESRILRLMKIMQKDSDYRNEMAKYCNDLYHFYQWTIQSAGYNSSIQYMIKTTIKKILGIYKKPSQAHLLNTLRCEVHRWALTYNLIYKTQQK